jgi:hypothetical protein
VGGALSTKNQGKTRQGISTAGFLPAHEPYNLELDTESEAKDAPGNTLDAANRRAMRILANNRSVHGTMASRLARATTTAEAAPSWTGIGADYAAWVRAFRRDSANPEAAIDKDAPKRVYLVVMNGAKHLSILHRLHRWKTPNEGHSCLDGCIVAFEGEVRDAHSLSLLWKFNKEEEVLLQLHQLPASALHHAALFYRNGNKDDQCHSRMTPPTPEWQGETVETCRRLVSIPVGWAPMFLDYPSMGTAFRRMIQLMLPAEATERRQL